MRKALFGTLILGALVLLWGTSALNVVAQGPTNDNPYTADFLFENNRYTILPETTLWYRFDYGSDRQEFTILIPNGRVLGLQFWLYTPDQAARFGTEEEDFVGSGSSPMVPCDEGRCQSPDLTWTGRFPVGGTYYVKVGNLTTRAVTFFFLIRGQGITLGPPEGYAPPPTATPTPTVAAAIIAPVAPAGPAPVVVATPENESPFFAIFIPDNRPQAIAGNTSLWYKFNYAGDRSNVTITLPNGYNNGFEFRVYTTEQAERVYVDDRSVGRGMPAAVRCETGWCVSSDLTWVGAFSVGGTYYVQVIYSKPNPATFVLQIVGTGVDIMGLQ